MLDQDVMFGLQTGVPGIKKGSPRVKLGSNRSKLIPFHPVPWAIAINCIVSVARKPLRYACERHAGDLALCQVSVQVTDYAWLLSAHVVESTHSCDILGSKKFGAQSSVAQNYKNMLQHRRAQDDAVLKARARNKVVVSPDTH